MSRFVKLFAANVIGAAGLGAAALSLSPAALAEPIVPPAIPSVPGLSMLQQLAADPSMVGGAVLQTAATAINGASALVGASPATLPVSPIGVAPVAPTAQLPVAPTTQMPMAPTAPLPVAPTAPLPASAPLGVESTLVPLLSQLGVPANLTALTPGAPATAPIAPLASPVMPMSALSFLP